MSTDVTTRASNQQNLNVPTTGQMKFGGIQALRAIAALLVVVDHSILVLIEKSGLSPALEPLAHNLGYLGVAVFFVISGFIMTHSTRNEFGRRSSPVHFLLRRVLRIVPLYWLATIAYATKLQIEGAGPTWVELIKSLLFVPYLTEDFSFRPVYPLGWTLNYEMYFYLAFSVALLFQKKLGLSLLAVVLAAVPLIRLAGGFNNPLFNTFFFFVSEPLILCFLVGIAIYQIVRTTGLSIPELPDGLLTAYAEKLGDASYSIYLSHIMVVAISARIWTALPMPDAFWPVFVLAMLIVTSGVGLLTYKFIEQPIIEALKPLAPVRRSS